MRVLILGGGGREHALAWACAESGMVRALFAAPGNAGIAQLATCLSLPIEDGAAVAAWVLENRIDLVLVGPEGPLVAGVADALRAAGVPVLGPDRSAARLEASKAFTHEIADACGAPMAAHAVFHTADAAVAHSRGLSAPPVVKYDGLAGGKGVVVAETHEEAEAAAVRFLAEPGASVVLEERLIGEEASLFVLCDGETVVPLGSAQDHKRLGEGDTGPNTGGMGAYSPAPVLGAELERRALDEIVRPVLAEMAARGAAYRGVLYAGLMITETGPKLIEINVRFGDPEAQVLLLRLGGDALRLMAAAAEGRLAGEAPPVWRDVAAMTVVMATRGYPGVYDKGSEIRGLAAAEAIEGVTVFHAGTRAGPDDRVLAYGGRVLGVSAVAPELGTARDLAYRAVAEIDWPEGVHRRDIGWRALRR